MTGADRSSIDLEYIDPRPEERKEADAILKEREDRDKEQRDREWDEVVDSAKAAGLAEPLKPEEVVRPDWGQSPLEVSSALRQEETDLMGMLRLCSGGRMPTSIPLSRRCTISASSPAGPGSEGNVRSRCA